MKKLLFLFATLSILGSCSNDDNVQPEPKPDEYVSLYGAKLRLESIGVAIGDYRRFEIIKNKEVLDDIDYEWEIRDTVVEAPRPKFVPTPPYYDDGKKHLWFYGKKEGSRFVTVTDKYGNKLRGLIAVRPYY